MIAVCSKCGCSHEKTHRNRTKCERCTVSGKTVQQRFFERVSKEGPSHPYNSGAEKCWLWTGSVDVYGYGDLRVDGKRMKAHRLSWMLHFGEVNSETHVLHCCDNPLCVNPSHLFLGTHQENMADMVRKGRVNYSGFVWAKSKLSESQRAQLIDMALSGISHTKISNHFGVTRAYVWQLAKANGWSGKLATRKDQRKPA